MGLNMLKHFWTIELFQYYWIGLSLLRIASQVEQIASSDFWV